MLKRGGLDIRKVTHANLQFFKRDLEVWREAVKLTAKPEKGWLEDYFPSEKVTFQGRAVKLRVGINLRYMSHKNKWGSYLVAKMGS